MGKKGFFVVRIKYYSKVHFGGDTHSDFVLKIATPN